MRVVMAVMVVCMSVSLLSAAEDRVATCGQQANERGLKGQARSAFMKECTKRQNEAKKDKKRKSGDQPGEQATDGERDRERTMTDEQQRAEEQERQRAETAEQERVRREAEAKAKEQEQSRQQAEQKAKPPAKQSTTPKPVTMPPKPATGQQRN